MVVGIAEAFQSRFGAALAAVKKHAPPPASPVDDEVGSGAHNVDANLSDGGHADVLPAAIFVLNLEVVGAKVCVPEAAVPVRLKGLHVDEREQGPGFS